MTTFKHTEQPKLLIKIVKILNKEDLQGLLRMGAPLDEYESEARCIYCGLEPKMSLKRIHNLVHRTFAYWFGDFLVDEKDKKHYLKAAQKIKKELDKVK